VSYKPTFLRALGSALAALFGVQKSNVHQQDFESETPFPFLLAGVILVIGFILVLVTIVKFVIAS